MTIWDQYPNLSDGELRTLVVATARVLMEADDARANLPPDLLNISTLSASRELAALLPDQPADQAQTIRNVLEDEDLSKEVSLAVLDEVRKNPELAAMVAEAYDEQAQKMVVTELLLLTGAVVILTIKLKAIQVSKKGVYINFYPASKAVETLLGGLMKGMI
jgi:hypothetical protein